MEILKLPPEIVEKICLNLDLQTLASCALVDYHLASLIYSSHFLDEYCRLTFNCSWVTAADICNVSIAVPNEFWFWLYTTMKLEDSGQENIIFHNKNLTKIGSFRHMFIMWLMCGLRPEFIVSNSLSYELYTLPERVSQVFEPGNQPDPVVNDTLMKIFLGLPELMELSCSNLDLFQMQFGGSVSLPMDIVCNDGIQPKLPLGFTSLFSIEIITSACFGKHAALLILIGKESWILWMGFLNISFDHNDTSIAENVFCQYFSMEEKASDIRYYAQNALVDINGYVYSLRDRVPCPLISGNHLDSVSMTICLAQEHHRSLKQKFDLVFYTTCSKLVTALINKFRTCPQTLHLVTQFLALKVSQNLQIGAYVTDLLKIELSKSKFSTFQHMSAMVFKCILERVACMFRNEIHFCAENSFCHSFLCRCLSPALGEAALNVEDKIEKCLSEKMKDGLYSPHMWPSHVLSAACSIVPILTEVLEADVQMMVSRGTKCVIPRLAQQHINRRLQNAGLVLTNRPPTKPRCAPLLKQVRLWTLDLESML